MFFGRGGSTPPTRIPQMGKVQKLMQIEELKKKYGTHGVAFISCCVANEIEQNGELSEKSLELIQVVLSDFSDAMRYKI